METLTSNFGIKQSPFAVVILDRNFEILNYSNRFLEELSASKADEIEGSNYFKLFPETPASFKKISKSDFRKKSKKIEIIRHLDSDGGYQWFKYHLSYWSKNKDDFAGLIVLREDITEIKRNEELLAKAMSVAQIGGWEVDLVHNAIYWSKVTKEIHEVPDDFVPDLEKGINFYKEGPCREKITEYVSEAIRTGQAWDTELQIVTGRGNIKWVHAKGEAEMHQGKCVRLFGTFQDIDSKKKMELEKQQIADRLAIATSAATVGVWDYNILENHLVWNEQMYRLYGITSTSFPEVYEAWEAAVHPEDKERAQMEVQLAIDGKKEFDTEFRVIWPNGETRHIRAMAMTQRDDSGKASKMIGTNWDITDIKSAESKTKELLHITNGQNESLMNFAHIVSHNLRSHSSNLSMLTTFLKKEQDEKEKENLLVLLAEASESLDETVRHLTEVVQVKTETIDKMKEVNVLDLIQNVEKNLSLLLHEKQAETSIRIPKNTRIKAIPAYLDSIFLNLFTNSIKYSSPNRPLKLKISSKQLSDRTLISFSDNGQGIDLARHGDKIFGMYKTFHMHKDAKGIGLFITKNQIESMQGEITVESTVGKGTTFHLTFLTAAR